jgi:hypothetical protein
MRGWTPAEIKIMANIISGKQRFQIVELQEAVGFLNDRDRDFAGSLLGQYTRNGRLTEKQWKWVETLSDRAMAKAPRDFALHVLGAY